MSEYGRKHTDGSRSGGQPPITPITDDKLKPCPFCGQRPKSGDSSYGYWSVFCHDGNLCDVAPSSEGATEDEARAAWNTRATDTHISRSSDYDLQVSKLVEAAQFIMQSKFRSIDRDNMEFEARFTTFQLEKMRAALAAFQEASND